MPDFVYVFAAFAVIAIIALFVIMRRAGQVEDLSTDSDSGLPSRDFLMTIDDTFALKVRGLVVVGKVEHGILRVGYHVQIASTDGSERYEAQVTGIEAFHNPVKSARAADTVALRLSDLTKDQIKPGMVVTLIM